MKILFICGCLEPGCDGVGDYTRKLCGELLRAGHDASIMAINDPYVQGMYSEFQNDGTYSIPVFRIEYGKFSDETIIDARKWTEWQKAEWLSLQYVPFAFQKKGIPWSLGEKLSILGTGRKWHIMFHELWVGMDKESPFKHKVWGRVQALIVKRIIQKLQPEKIHTQAKLYKIQLDTLGVKAQLLPLFGNIPVITKKKEKRIEAVIELVVFGHIQPKAPIEDFVRELVEYGNAFNRKIHFTFIGRSGAELDKWISVCTGKGIEVNVLGEQNVEEISAIFSRADWGLSSTPVHQIEKSGTVAAMREHKLPVYCVARSWSPSGIESPTIPDGIRVYETGTLDMTEMKLKRSGLNQLNEVSNEFIKSLGTDTIGEASKTRRKAVQPFPG